MSLKQGDSVTVDGKVSKIECWWGAGKHRMFRLADGRVVMDLHLSADLVKLNNVVSTKPLKLPNAPKVDLKDLDEEED